MAGHGQNIHSIHSKIINQVYLLRVYSSSQNISIQVTLKQLSLYLTSFGLLFTVY